MLTKDFVELSQLVPQSGTCMKIYIVNQNLNVKSMVSVKYSLKQYPPEIFAKVIGYVYVYG